MTAYGLHVRPPFRLPFALLSGLPHRSPDVTIRIGAAPASLPTPADRHGLWESAPGTLLPDIPDGVRVFSVGRGYGRGPGRFGDRR